MALMQKLILRKMDLTKKPLGLLKIDNFKVHI